MMHNVRFGVRGDGATYRGAQRSKDMARSAEKNIGIKFVRKNPIPNTQTSPKTQYPIPPKKVRIFHSYGTPYSSPYGEYAQGITDLEDFVCDSLGASLLNIESWPSPSFT